MAIVSDALRTVNAAMEMHALQTRVLMQGQPVHTARILRWRQVQAAGHARHAMHMDPV